MVNKRLLSLCDESKKWIGMTVLMNWISIICNIAIVVYIGNVIDKLYNNDFNINILGSAVFILAMLGIRFVCNFLSTKFSSKSSTEVRKGLRSKIYQKLLDLGVNYKDTISTSSTVQISVDGVEALEIYFGRYLPQLFYSLLAPLTLFVVVAPISFKAAIVLLICVPLIPVSIVAVMKFAKKLLGKYWGIYTNLGDSFLENLHGLTTLKIYDLDEEKNEEMNKEAENFRNITMKVLSMQLNSINIMDLIAFGGSALGIIIATNQYSQGNITIGQVLIIILLSSEFFIPLRLLGSYFHVAMNGMAASDKIFNLLDAEIEKIENLTKEEMNLLKDINIDIKENKVTALIGPSGCGKSTFLRTLNRMNDLIENVTIKGKIEVDGEDIYQTEDVIKLRTKVGMVFQKPNPFPMSIYDNIAYGPRIHGIRDKKILDKIVEESLRGAAIWDEVKDRLKTSALGLSGGQQQRICIARAIAMKPEVILMDEPTSALDPISTSKVEELIEELKKDYTIVIVTHNMQQAARISDDTAFFLNGVLVEYSETKDMFTAPKDKRTEDYITGRFG